MVMAPFTVSLRLSLDGLSDEFSRVVRGIVLDLTPIFCDCIGPDVLTFADGAMDGAGNYVVRFSLDAIPFDLKVRAALRARGLDIPAEFHFRSPVGGLDANGPKSAIIAEAQRLLAASVPPA
jgi:hypothetical protein